MVGQRILRELAVRNIRIRQGCQKLELFDYMNRIGPRKCKEQIDVLTDALYMDVDYWKKGGKKLGVPSKQVVREFILWACDI